jgi:predicted RNA-binding protein YlqC (UPF0109 family)
MTVVGEVREILKTLLEQKEDVGIQWVVDSAVNALRVKIWDDEEAKEFRITIEEVKGEKYE